jgi:predicted metal-dependent hydrolase
MSYNIHIEHSRNRTSRAFCRNGAIVVRLARNLSASEIREHTESLVRRMKHMLAREEKKTLIDPFRHLVSGPPEKLHAAHRSLWRAFSKEHIDIVRDRVHELNARTLRVPIRSVRLRFAQTQWGSCSPKGDVTINPALLFLPEKLLEYVIIHELAHRIVANHSARFWATVERAMPDFRTAYRHLRTYRLPSPHNSPTLLP